MLSAQCHRSSRSASKYFGAFCLVCGRSSRFVSVDWFLTLADFSEMQKEIEVLLHEIFIPILEMRTSTLKQKAVILGMLSRLCQDPQALVEIYLNYDCDSEAVDNIYEQ